MCTAIIQSVGVGGLLLAGNRDELITRQRGEGPQLHELGRGLAAIYPRDVDAGGTWVGVNTAGLVATLLNNYPADAALRAPAAAVSRGVLVPAMLEHETLEGAWGALEAMGGEVARLRPFWLLVAWAPVDAEASALRATWDGARLELERLALPAHQISSSVDYSAVEANRRAQLAGLLSARGPWSGAQVDEVFGGHKPERGASSVCMHRGDAGTVSHTRVSVSAEAVSLSYYGAPLCEGPSPQIVSLARR